MDGKADWDKRFMQLALHVAAWSKDRSTRVGAVIAGPDYAIRSVGYNGFPRGVHDFAFHRHQRPLKYLWTEHAERNAIYNAVRIGIPITGCTMYLSWFPCMDCARAMVQVGLVELVAIEPDHEHLRWGNDFRNAMELFDETGVKVRFLGCP